MQIPDFNEDNNKKKPVLLMNSRLVDQVKAAGNLTTPEVEAAFRAVPRHLFLPHLPLEEVYQDQAITTKMEAGRFVSSSSQPSIMAIMLEQLHVRPGQRILEIGAGTGYNAALLATLVGPAGQVVTIDIDDDIVETARLNLQGAGFSQVTVLCADGALGYGELAPYDRIILTVNAADIAPAWQEQLAPDGRLLLPLSLRGPQLSVAFDRSPVGLESVSQRSCGFVELRGSLGENNPTIPVQEHAGIISVRPSQHRPILGETILRLLQGSYQEFSLPVRANRSELALGFVLWLSLHHEAYYELFAYDQAAEKAFVPMLFEYRNKGYTRRTVGLLGADGLCALVWDTRAIRKMALAVEAIPVTLRVRAYGTGGQVLAEQLQTQFLAWHAAGRPDEQHLHIVATPLAHRETDEPGATDAQAVTITKRHTRFVCTWR